MTHSLMAKELKEQASLVDLLARLGYHPIKSSGREQLYVSMLREPDTKLSFSVNDELGVWFDQVTRKGGNIIDFGLAYWQHLSFTEVVEKLQVVYAMIPCERTMRPRKPVKIPHYIVEELKDLGSHPAITSYLKSRGIFEIGRNLLNEVYYYAEDQRGQRKNFSAAGWQNESGGWEVRNKYFKGHLGHKSISFIKGHDKDLAVFEDYINYLSWKTENPEADSSVLILNGPTLLPAGIAKAKAFSSIDIFLDRHQAGRNATAAFIKALPYASDRSTTYAGFNDYNDKLVAGLKNEVAEQAVKRQNMVVPI